MRKEIEWLLFDSGISRYRIHKATGIGAAVLSNYTLGKSNVGCMRLDNAEKLYDYFKVVLKKLGFGYVDFQGKTYYMTSQVMNLVVGDDCRRYVASAIDESAKKYELEWLLVGGVKYVKRFDGSNVTRIISV